jgi:hypothetical protein
MKKILRVTSTYYDYAPISPEDKCSDCGNALGDADDSMFFRICKCGDSISIPEGIDCSDEGIEQGEPIFCMDCGNHQYQEYALSKG